MSFPALAPDEARARLHELVVIDVRTPAEYASGHLPDAYNIPLDRLDEAVPVLRAAAGRGDLLVVCASGNRSADACRVLSAAGIEAATLSGGTGAWHERGHDLHRPAGARTGWAMERQVRFTAGGLVLLGLVAGRRLPAARWLSAGVASGLVFSALTDTCGMAVLLGKLPHNRPSERHLRGTLAALADRTAPADSSLRPDRPEDTLPSDRPDRPS
ncbi:rhodanese-like domain-containing protein [Streptomyces sparsus]